MELLKKTEPVEKVNGEKESEDLNETVVDVIDDDAAANFAPFAAKMEAAGLLPLVVRAFHRAYNQLLQGATGYISEAEISSVPDLPNADNLDQYRLAGVAALPQTAIIKLNGGLGTTMGMDGAKSLIEVKQGLTFLDITIRQVLHLRRKHGVPLPLVLMNSFNTRSDSLPVLERNPHLSQDIPYDFCQHKIPKIWQENLRVVDWPNNPELEWCPPGHGDIYLALQTSGMLNALLDQGYNYAFVSNADNLGASLDLDILGYFANNELPFLMEVAKRSSADRKGGHLAMSSTRGLVLREVAQCPPQELDSFQDIQRYRYFNTNNIWLHLPALKRLLDEHDGLLPLPLIRNSKPVDPTIPDSPGVYQLETAMGQAIGLFPKAEAIQIPRTRFMPVKDTADLLAVSSDLYVLDHDFTLHPNPARALDEDATVGLDKRYYGLIDQFQERFAHGMPSLLNCRRLSVRGDFYFGANLVFTGDVELLHEGERAMWLR